jgi:hypothetical protein
MQAETGIEEGRGIPDGVLGANAVESHRSTPLPR